MLGNAIGNAILFLKRVILIYTWEITKSFSPALIRNAEGDNISESDTTTLIEIIGKVGNVLTLNVLPENLINISIDWFVQSLDPSDNNVGDIDYNGNYLVQDKITDFDFINKKITLVDVTDFDIGEKICFYSPWANYEYIGDQTVNGIITRSGAGWRSQYVTAGSCWYDEGNERYVVLVNGRANSPNAYSIGFAYSADLIEWTMGNEDQPVILRSDHVNFANNVWAVGNVVELDGGRVAFAVTGYSGANYPYIHVIQMDRDCTNIVISDSLISGHKAFSGGLAKYNGKYVICECNRDNPYLELWTAEMWQSDSLTTGWEKVCDMFTTEYDDNDSIWMEGHNDMFCPFVERGKLYCFVGGTTRYIISGMRGNRMVGLMVYDSEGNSWEPLNDFAPEIINPMYFDNIPSEDYAWATDHVGGYFSFIKRNEECYCFTAFKNGSYTIGVMKLVDKT